MKAKLVFYSASFIYYSDYGDKYSKYFENTTTFSFACYYHFVISTLQDIYQPFGNRKQFASRCIHGCLLRRSDSHILQNRHVRTLIVFEFFVKISHIVKYSKLSVVFAER